VPHREASRSTHVFLPFRPSPKDVLFSIHCFTKSKLLNFSGCGMGDTAARKASVNRALCGEIGIDCGNMTGAFESADERITPHGHQQFALIEQ
jgi:hypothetical protein